MAEKNSREKSNFRKYNEIKTKCFPSLSSLKVFIKIGFVVLGREVLVGRLWLLKRSWVGREGQPPCPLPLSPPCGLLPPGAFPSWPSVWKLHAAGFREPTYTCTNFRVLSAGAQPPAPARACLGSLGPDAPALRGAGGVGPLSAASLGPHGSPAAVLPRRE